MQEKTLKLNFTSAHLSELDSKDQELIANAKKASATCEASTVKFNKLFSM